jgi:hypothetical protein
MDDVKVGEVDQLIELYKNLISYKYNMFKIETLLDMEQDESVKQELDSLKKELQDSINLNEE